MDQIYDVALVAAQKDILFRNRFQDDGKFLAERNNAAIGERGVNLMEPVFKVGNAFQGQVYRYTVHDNGEFCLIVNPLRLP